MEFKDTLTMMMSDDYKERFKAEYYQLDKRLENLANVINGYYAGTLDFKPDTPVLLLEKQFKAMQDYIIILDIRAQIENIDLACHAPEANVVMEEPPSDIVVPEPMENICDPVEDYPMS